jgi:hydrogenase/urease accessory protein HupE
MRGTFVKIVILLCLGMQLYAHQTALSYLTIDRTGESLHVRIKKPLQDLGAEDLKIRFPRSCYETTSQSHQEARYLVTEKMLKCGPDAFKNARIEIANLRASDVGVITDYQSKDFSVANRLLTARKPYLLLNPGESEGANFFAYIRLGIIHILTGYDHLLFVLSLMMLVESRRVLLMTITAFTVAHSLTLGLATMGMIHFSIPYIEALIALSIIFLAREILSGTHRSLSYRFPWIVALLFGLIHGMGFATALGEVGIPESHRLVSLFLFNLGVEIGQLIFILSIWLVINLFSSCTQRYHAILKKGTLYMIGVIAAYWFIERVALLI